MVNPMSAPGEISNSVLQKDRTTQGLKLSFEQFIVVWRLRNALFMVHSADLAAVETALRLSGKTSEEIEGKKKTDWAYFLRRCRRYDGEFRGTLCPDDCYVVGFSKEQELSWF